MDQSYSNIIEIRHKYKHLTLDERGAIQVLHRQGYSLWQIAAMVGCAHTTVFNELRCGTIKSKSRRERPSTYVAKRGQKYTKSIEGTHESLVKFITQITSRLSSG